MGEKFRDSLLVTIGARAAYMECAGRIRLPSGLNGEDVLTDFARQAVKVWNKSLRIENFDEFIETALIKNFGIEEMV